MLTSIYNPTASNGSGMSKLLDADSDISAIKSTDIATISSIIKKLNAWAKQKFTANYVVPPAIATRQDAQDKSNPANQATQAIVESKEGFAEAITAKVVSAIVDPILRTADCSDYKGVDEYNLSDIIAAVLQGADGPRSGDVLTKLADVISYRFNFQQKIVTNVKLMQVQAACMQYYGIAVGADHLALIILSNLDRAAQEEWRSDFRTPLHSIWKKFPYDHVHDNTYIADTMGKLAGADAVRKLTDTPRKIKGNANAVTDGVG